MISLDQLTFDEENYKVYFVDVKKQQEECRKQWKQHLEEQRILQQFESEHNSYEEEELRRLEIERSLENLIHNYEIDKLIGKAEAECSVKEGDDEFVDGLLMG